MKLEFLHKTIESSGGNCPAAYRTERGTYVIQGVKLDAATTANLHNLGDGETAVEVPADVIERIIAAAGA